MSLNLFWNSTAAGATLSERTHSALRENGLTLKDAEIASIKARKTDALRELKRFEVGQHTTESVIEAFADSPFIMRETCAESFALLVELFLELRDLVPSAIGDEELTLSLREQFDAAEGVLDVICIEELGRLLTEELVSPADSAEYRIVDDEGREYVFNATEWEYDEQASGWAGEEWADD